MVVGKGVDQRGLGDLGDISELREVKVKLPMDQVLRLHYARMTKRKNFSDIVSTALTRYFDEFLEP